MSYQNNNNNNGEQKVYKNANVGRLYLKQGQNGEFFSGDFCSLQILGRIDQEGNISIQFPTEFAEELKQMIGVFKESSGLGAKYEADRAEYLAKKAAQEGAQAPAPAAQPPRKTYAPTQPAAKPYAKNTYRR